MAPELTSTSSLPTLDRQLPFDTPITKQRKNNGAPSTGVQKVPVFYGSNKQIVDIGRSLYEG